MNNTELLTTIDIFREQELKGWNECGDRVNMTMQIADVKVPLGSVYRIVKGGNVVVFEEGKSRIYNKATGKVTPIRENRGSYEMDIWVERGDEISQVDDASRVGGVTSRDEVQYERVFTWQDY